MTINEYSVQPLFAEPYLRANISHAISAAQVDFIKKLKMNPNKTNLISDNLYIFNEPELKSIKKAVNDALGIFAREVLGINQRLCVTQSWSLMNPPGSGMHGHSHSNSLVSGSLYFTDMPNPPANMVFGRYGGYRQIELNPQPDRINLYNAPSNVVTPQKGEVILFASSLQHFVEANHATVPRHSIAFNSFVKGKIGNFRDVSELTIA